MSTAHNGSQFVHHGLVIAMVALTLFVGNTAIQIEILNAQNDYLLPRQHLEERVNRKWRIGAARLCKEHLEKTIAIDRHSRYVVQHPKEPVPDLGRFYGPPYSPDEQEMLETEMKKHARLSALHEWVRTFGLLQYILAPTALFLAIRMVSTTRSRALSVVAIVCALSHLVAMTLMYHRGYFGSLGLLASRVGSAVRTVHCEQRESTT